MQRVLNVYVDQYCPGCVEARRTAAQIAQDYPNVTVQVIEVGSPGASVPETVFATPTFMLGDRLMQLGNPGPDDIIRWLGERPLATAGEPNDQQS